MQRNYDAYPKDALGDLLWQLRERYTEEDAFEVEFSVIFPTQELALKFGQVLLENNQKLSFTPYQGDENLPWEITAYPHMPLVYENLVGYQALLEQTSKPLNGKFDGWYCPALNQVFEVKDD